MTLYCLGCFFILFSIAALARLLGTAFCNSRVSMLFLSFSLFIFSCCFIMKSFSFLSVSAFRFTLFLLFFFQLSTYLSLKELIIMLSHVLPVMFQQFWISDLAKSLLVTKIYFTLYVVSLEEILAKPLLSKASIMVVVPF